MEPLHFNPQAANATNTAASVGTLLQAVTRQSSCELHGVYEEKGFRFRQTLGQGKNQAQGQGRSQEAPGAVIWCTCPKCQAEEDAAKMRMQAAAQLANQQAQLQAQWQERLQRSWLPSRFVGKTFENFVCSTPAQKQAFDLVRAYTQAFQSNAAQGRGLIFLGGVGTGKSHLAAAVLQAVMAAGQGRYRGLYMTVSDIIRAVRGTWRKDAVCSEGDMLSKLVQVDLLVLDEVGKQYGTQGEAHILFDVLDGRYRDMKPTILLGNINADELSVYLGERVADRLRETNTAIVFGWESYRRGV